MRVKIFLDDKRSTPEGFVRCYWPDEVFKLLETGPVHLISLDHDLGDDERGTGDDVVTYLQEQLILNNRLPPAVTIHSDNPSGCQKMWLGVSRLYERAYELTGKEGWLKMLYAMNKLQHRIRSLNQDG